MTLMKKRMHRSQQGPIMSQFCPNVLVFFQTDKELLRLKNLRICSYVKAPIQA